MWKEAWSDERWWTLTALHYNIWSHSGPLSGLSWCQYIDFDPRHNLRTIWVIQIPQKILGLPQIVGQQATSDNNSSSSSPTSSSHIFIFGLKANSHRQKSKTGKKESKKHLKEKIICSGKKHLNPRIYICNSSHSELRHSRDCSARHPTGSGGGQKRFT